MAKAKDRFDRLPKEPGRVGAHRGAIQRGGGWLGFLLILIGIAVLTAAGFLVATNVFKIKLDFDFPFLDRLIPTASPTPTPTTPPPVVTDPAQAVARGTSIMVLNGTSVATLGTDTGNGLAASGWPIATIGTTGSPVDTTVVYYTDPKNADIARGLAQVLGFGEVRPVSPDVYPGVGIVIVLGADDPSVPPPPPAPTPS